MFPRHRAAATCAVVGILASWISVLAIVGTFQGQPSALVHMTANERMAKLARKVDEDFALWTVGHYDGVYFYAIAMDPLATGDASERIDLAAFRYTHPGYGWLGTVLSLGRDSAIPTVLAFIAIVSVGLAAALASLISAELGRSPWGGLFVAVNPGLIYAATVLTAEPLAAAVLGAVLLAWMKGRLRSAAVGILALCFIREYLLLVPVALAGWEVLKGVRGRRAPDQNKRLIALAVGPVVFGIWYLYLWKHFAVFPFSEGEHVLDLPLVGWFDSMRRAAALARVSHSDNQLGSAALPLLVSAFVLLFIGLIKAVRLQTVVDAVYLALALLVMCYGWIPILYPKDLIRAVAITLALLPGVMLLTPREPPPNTALLGPEKT